MARLYTWPSDVKLAAAAGVTPEFMRPATTPFAAVLEGILSYEECDLIQERLDPLQAYVHHGCGAVTRECISDSSLDPIENIARDINHWFFGYDLDPGQHSWLQTYEAGEAYQRHMDVSPGQTRKLTAVAMISKHDAYAGGELYLYAAPKELLVPKIRGTVVVFSPWLEHEVLPVTRGVRQTINMGFWGPPFK